MAFHKILKKHDKMLPHAPCRQFYVAHLHQQPWVQGNYSDLLVQLSNVYSKLRGDTSGVQNDDSAQVCGRLVHIIILNRCMCLWGRASHYDCHAQMHVPFPTGCSPLPQGFCRSTTKYWVRNEDVSTVKHHILQHLPVFQVWIKWLDWDFIQSVVQLQYFH